MIEVWMDKETAELAVGYNSNTYYVLENLYTTELAHKSFYGYYEWRTITNYMDKKDVVKLYHSLGEL